MPLSMGATWDGCSSNPNDYIIFDDFNNQSLSGEWSVGGTPTYANTNALDGYYIRFDAGTESITGLTSLSGDVVISFKAKVHTLVNDKIQSFDVVTGSVNNGFIVVPWTTEGTAIPHHWDYYDGAWKTYNIDSQDTWVNISLYASNTASDGWDVYFNNTAGFLGIKPYGNNRASNYELKYYLGYASATEYNLIDDVRVWNYTTYGLACPPAPVVVSNASYSVYINDSADISIGTSAVTTYWVNGSMNYSNTNLSSLNGTMTYLYGFNTTLNHGCGKFENLTCTQWNGDFNRVVMTKINETYFNLTRDDTDIYPAYYPYYAQTMESYPVKSDYAVYINHYLLWEILNFTTTTGDNLFIALEMNAENQTPNEPIDIYYCNSSYTHVGNPDLNPNCELQLKVTADGLPFHWHETTKHYLFGLKPTITKTHNSSIVIGSDATSSANGWLIRYMSIPSYKSKQFETGNWNTLVRSSSLFDMHIHQLLDTDVYYQLIEYADGNNNYQNSSIVLDYYDIDNRPPSTPTLYAPCNTTIGIDSLSSSLIYYNWSEAYDYDNDTFNYSVFAVVNGTILSNYLFSVNNGTTQYNYYTNSTGYNHATYKTKIVTCDTANACSATFSSCTYDVCIPQWYQTSQPCVGGAEQYIYADNHSCGVYNDVPVLNGTYQDCVVTNAVAFNEGNWLFILYIILIIGLIIFGIFMPVAWVINAFVMGFFAFKILFDFTGREIIPLFATILFIGLVLGITGLIRALSESLE